MTFLAPGAAIVAGALALPALLALYFLRLRRRPVRVGSTMLWRQAAEDLQANVPFRWLRPSLLLLAQLLGLALLLLALARPALHVEGEMPARVFVLIDRSASMRATDMPGGRTRLEEAVRLAGGVVDRIVASGSPSEVTVIAFGAEPQILIGPTRSASDLRRTLASIGPTDQPGDPGAALRLVQALTVGPEEEEQDAGRPLVVVCSDGDAGTDPPALRADVRFERAAPEEPAGNVGIVALAARRAREAPSTVRLFARVLSTLDETTTVPLVVRFDGRPVLRRAVEIAGADDKGPGQTPVALEFNAPGAGLVELALDRPDALEADNSAALLIGSPRRPSVVLVRRREAEEAGAGWLLTDVLRELDLSALTLMSSARLEALGAEAYAGVDLAIFDGAPAPGPPPVPSLHFGAPPEIPGLRAEPTPGRVLPVLSWDRSSTIMRDVSLDAVRVGRGVAFGPDESPPAGYAELARTAAGAVIVSVLDGQNRRVLCGFDLVQSTWPVDYSFPIFLANAVETLPRTGALAGGWGATTDAPATPPNPPPPGATLRAPDGSTRTVAGRSVGVLELAGVWTSESGPIPVNLLNERESTLHAPRSLGLPGGAIARAGEGLGRGEPREVWHWFLIAAVAVLTLEWVLFGARARVS